MKPAWSAPDLLSRLQLARASISPCLPPPWLRGGHRQTLLAHLLPSPNPPLGGENLNVTLEDLDEQIVTTFVQGQRPVAVYLFHGLGGTSEAAYMRRTALVGKRLGYSLFLNNHRGCGLGAGLASEPYHSGRAEDLSAVIAFGRERLPDHLHVAIGFSLSANALLLLSARQRASVLPDVAIAVNGPIELDRASRRLTEGLNRIYDLNFLRDLNLHVKQLQRAGRLRVEIARGQARTLRDFDELYTAPAGGFQNREEYYRTCSARQYLPHIEIPAVLLTSRDDPFIDAEDYVTASLGPSTILHLEDHGGHMGYLTSLRRRWLDHALETYLKAFSES